MLAVKHAKSRAIELVDPQITMLDLNFGEFLGLNGPVTFSEVKKEENEDGVNFKSSQDKIYVTTNFKPSGPKMLEMIQFFNRENQWVSSIEPTFRNVETQELYQICVTSYEYSRK